MASREQLEAEFGRHALKLHDALRDAQTLVDETVHTDFTGLDTIAHIDATHDCLRVARDAASSMVVYETLLRVAYGSNHDKRSKVRRA